MQKRLNSMVQAIAIVRTPLENFYNSLDDEQRQRFNAIGEPNRRGLLTVREPLCGQGRIRVEVSHKPELNNQLTFYL